MNRTRAICTAGILFAVLLAAIVALHATGAAEACQAIHSTDVCEFTLK